MYEARLRAAHYDVVVVSPHFDDAVYSLGATLARARSTEKNVLVVTVFGHGRDEAPSGRGPYDDYETREAEERAAMDELDADYVWLNLPELLFRHESTGMRLRALVPHASLADSPSVDAISTALAAVAGPTVARGGALYLPLGVGAHPDHRLVHEAGRRAFSGAAITYYEDVPYALDGALLASRLATLGGTPGPSPWAWARATCRLAFRGFGRAFGVLPLAFAFVVLEGCRRWISATPRVALEPYEEPCDEPFVERKVEAMARYRTQTPLFFAHPVRDALAAPFGAPRERVWRIA